MQRLCYTLRKGVKLIENDGQTLLLSSFPLKALRIAPPLAPVFRAMDHDSECSLEELGQKCPSGSKAQLESYLSGLVKKGFLEETGSSPQDWLPFVSVIIPVRNRPSDIKTCIQSLLGLSYPSGSLEIIVVDDASEDETPDVAAAFPVILHRMEERKGASVCRNAGVWCECIKRKTYLPVCPRLNFKLSHR